MSWELFGLYLFTRLESINTVLTILTLALGIALIIAGVVWVATIDYPDDKEHQTARSYIAMIRKYFAWALVAAIIVPSQKEATFIIAGTGVVEAAKTDTAQRIAAKSVGIVEKYLDEMLAEKEKGKK